MDKFIKVFQKVIMGWDFVELFFCIVLFPWSLLYIGFRMIQEWGVK